MSESGHELSPRDGVNATNYPHSTHHSQRTANDDNLSSSSQTDILVDDNDAVPDIDPDDADSNSCLFLDRRRGDIVRQRDKDAEYVQAFEKLSPKERQSLEPHGLDRPWVSYTCNGYRGKDLAESSFASQDPDIAALVDREAREPEASEESSILRDLIDYLLLQPNMRLMVECLAFVLNPEGCDHKTKRSIAKRHHVSEETVSRYCKKARQEFNLPPPQSTHGKKFHNCRSPIKIQPGGETTDPPTRGAVEVLSKMVAYLLSHRNVGLTLDCLALVFNLGVYNGESMTAIGNRHNITRQAVSTRCVDIAKDLDIPPSRAMRSEGTRESCRRAQLKGHRNME